MQELVLQINELEERQRADEESLRGYAGRLGRTIAHLEGMTPVAPALRDEYLMREENLRSAREEKSLVQELVEAQKKGRKDLESLKARKSAMEKELDQLRFRIGAIAFEQAQSESCAPEIKDILAPIVSRYRRLKENSREGSFLSATTSKLLLAISNQDKDFLSAFRTVESAGHLKKLVGERASSLVAEYLSRMESLAGITAELTSLGEDMGDADVYTEGHEKALDKRLQDCTYDEEEAAVSYGIYLFENAVKWLKDTTDPAIVDLVSDMLKTHELLEEETRQIQTRRNQIEIYNQMEKVRINDRAIEKLEAERERLLRQIEELRAENEIIENRIRSLDEGETS